jgi:hypothetical protein
MASGERPSVSLRSILWTRVPSLSHPIDGDDGGEPGK